MYAYVSAEALWRSSQRGREADEWSTVELGLLVGDTSEKLAVDVALSNSFGFGGHNSAVLFGKYVPTVE